MSRNTPDKRHFLASQSSQTSLFSTPSQTPMPTTPFLEGLDHLVLDCDGVVYVDDQPIEGAADLIACARSRDMGILFITNDMTSSSERIATRIRAVGAVAEAEEVLHAGKAAALYHSAQGHGNVLVAGTKDLCTELLSHGVQAWNTHEWQKTTAVDALLVGGYDGLAFTHLDILLQAWQPNMPIVTCNLDRTFPSTSGPRLGCGSVAASLAYATGSTLINAGKPSTIIFREAEDLLGPGEVGIVGDTLMSDIAGANLMGWKSAWFRKNGTPHDGSADPDIATDNLRSLFAGL